jgi:hypothetical protein
VQVRVYWRTPRGANWRQLGGLSMQDGAGSISITPGGMIVVGGMYTGMLISRDRGRTWHAMASVDNTDAVGGGSVFAAVMTSNRAGFAIAAMHAWFTSDGGRTWRQLAIR